MEHHKPGVPGALRDDSAFGVESPAVGGDDARVQLLGSVAATDAAELLERSGHLEALGGQLADVSLRSRGHLVLVRGEAGIGKTALLRRFCDELDRSVRVLWAACDPLFLPRPLGPLLDVARVTEGELRARVEAGAKPHDVAASLLGELEAPAPTVLVLEDIHWADEATLDVVRLVGRRLEGVPALVLASYRDDELDRFHPLRIVLGELPGRGAVTRLELAPLSRASVARLAEASPIDADELYERTAGNPFFVTEALAAETERVPATIRDAVSARAARLSLPARAVLDAVAVVPQRAELWLLQALIDNSLEALDECLSSGMLKAEADGVAFRHELARLSVEDAITPDRAVVLHRRAIAALAVPAIATPDLARLAHHAEAAGAANSVLRFAPAAAEYAASVGALREAQNQYGRALRFAGGVAPETRADLLERFADQGFLTDQREEAVQALKEAGLIHRARDDLLGQGRVLWKQARLMSCMGRRAEARATGREAVAVLEQLPPGRELARACAAVSHTTMIAGEADETIAWGNRAIELAQRFDDNEALVASLNNVGTVELGDGLAGGQEKLERGLALALQAGLGPEVGRAYNNLSNSLGRCRRWDEADRVTAVGIAFCREHGLEAYLNSLLANRALSDLARGRWDEAADTATAILAGPMSSVPGPRYEALLTLALVRARRGDPEYQPLLDAASELAAPIGDLDWVGPTAAARAEVAWLEGRTAAIAGITQRPFELAVEHQDPPLLGQLACWRWRAGLLVEPPPGTDEVYRRQIEGDWEQAVRNWRELGCPYEAALALADSGDAAALRRALDELHALGARPAAAIVTRRLRELGERGLRRGPRSQTRENPAGLTARELEVLPLLAHGLRNAEIGERLVVSTKTVDHHVSSIIRKLGAHTRGEAAAEAGRLGLLGGPLS